MKADSLASNHPRTKTESNINTGILPREEIGAESASVSEEKMGHLKVD
jgi:hypothetical protein